MSKLRFSLIVGTIMSMNAEYGRSNSNEHGFEDKVVGWVKSLAIGFLGVVERAARRRENWKVSGN